MNIGVKVCDSLCKHEINSYAMRLHPTCGAVGETNTYEITRIPSMFGGEVPARRAGLSVSTRGFYPGSGCKDA